MSPKVATLKMHFGDLKFDLYVLKNDILKFSTYWIDLKILSQKLDQ